MTFGVLSELTIREKYPENQEKLEGVLRFFRQKKVDAVAVLGDIMYSGQISELVSFADSKVRHVSQYARLRLGRHR